MKSILTYSLLIISLLSYSQTENTDYSRMIEAEMKSASTLKNFVVNPNTQNYDITYHELNFNVNPEVYNIAGKVKTTFTALSDMNTVVFDFYKKDGNPFSITSVKNNATSLTFTHSSSHELIIDLPTTLNTGSSYTVEITYSGSPEGSAFGSFATGTHGASATPVLWTLSEPYGAREWWPCKQDLNDKVDAIDVYITAPSQYISVSNGLEQTVVINGNATSTTHFKHNYPIPAYLIAIAVTNYSIFNQQGGLGTVEKPYFPIINYLYPETDIVNNTDLDDTPTIINLYEDLLGDYPYRNEKYGHAQFGWGGGMEHSTVSFMGSFGRRLIAHEMAHQWFGNKVTCGSWKDVWLNEGLTEYMAGVVVENLDGIADFIDWKINKTNSVTSQPGGNLYLTDSQLTNVNRIFSGRLSYDKGAMVTNMIRYRMGDSNFFQALRNYLSDPNLAYGYAITPQFQSHLESASGLSFTEFFNDWVYNEGYPSYNIEAQNIGNGQAKITVTQIQSDPSVTFFEMPLTVQLNGSGMQTQNFTLDNTSNNQEFIVNVPFLVTDVVFDPNSDIISRDNFAYLNTAAFEVDNQISIYPNPASASIQVKFPNHIHIDTIEIYNALGQLVQVEKTTIFTVEKLNSGAYFIKMSTNEGIIHKNFIKK